MDWEQKKYLHLVKQKQIMIRQMPLSNEKNETYANEIAK